MDMVLGLHEKNWAKSLKNIQVNTILRVSNILTHPVDVYSLWRKITADLLLLFYPVELICTT